MAPGTQLDEVALLTRRIAELQSENLRLQNQSDGQFRRLANEAPIMVWTSGPDAQCTWVNRTWLTFRGRQLEDEIGNGWMDGLHPDDRDLYLEMYLKAFTGRQGFRLQSRFKRGDGTYAWVETSGQALVNPDGTFEGYMGAAVDITDRKRGVFTPDEESVRLVFALTERERQVLVLIAEGKSTKEAAARLGISYKTADSHRSRILEKLGVHETASMVRYAIRAGLIEP